MWNNAKMNSLAVELDELKTKLEITKYQLKQCSYVSRVYEKKLAELMGADEFYQLMKDTMYQLLEKDHEFLCDPIEDDSDLDEIVEDLK